MAREIPLSQGRVALVDDADYELVNAKTWSFVAKGGASGYAYHYWRKGGRGFSIGLHRFLLDAPADLQVDHINGDGLDNRRANLRLCSHTENARNRRVSRNNTSGFKGVKLVRNGRFEANIRDGHLQAQAYLGSFDNPYSAALAYDRAAIERHGEFARLNFDPKRDWIVPYPVEGLRALQRARHAEQPVIVGDEPVTA